MNAITIFFKHTIKIDIWTCCDSVLNKQHLPWMYLVQAGGLTGQRNIRTVEKRKYLSLPAAVFFPLISRSRFVLYIFQCRRGWGEGGNGVDLCSGCSPPWSPLSWPLPCRWESHTGWQGWQAAGWLGAWSWWCRWPPAQSGPGRRYEEKEEKCGESQQEEGRGRERESQRKRSGGRGQGGEKSHWRVLTPTIGTDGPWMWI